MFAIRKCNAIAKFGLQVLINLINNVKMDFNVSKNRAIEKRIGQFRVVYDGYYFDDVDVMRKPYTQHTICVTTHLRMTRTCSEQLQFISRNCLNKTFGPMIFV